MIRAIRAAVRRHGTRGARFALVGALNTGIDVGVFAVAFYALGWPLLAAHTVGFGIAVGNSYILNKMWTFGDRSTGAAAVAGGVRFLVISVIGLLLGALCLWLAAKVMPAIVAKFATVGVTFVWNYWASARFVFRP